MAHFDFTDVDFLSYTTLEYALKCLNLRLLNQIFNLKSEILMHFHTTSSSVSWKELMIQPFMDVCSAVFYDAFFQATNAHFVIFTACVHSRFLPGGNTGFQSKFAWGQMTSISCLTTIRNNQPDASWLQRCWNVNKVSPRIEEFSESGILRSLKVYCQNLIRGIRCLFCHLK